MTTQNEPIPSLDNDTIRKNIKNAMSKRNVNYEQLSSMFVDAGYKITKSNLRTYIEHRNISLTLIYFLSKTLQISTDYLLGLTNYDNTTMEGFETNLNSPKYKKYCSEYYFYYYATRTNTDEKLEIAKISIDNNYNATLTIPVGYDKKIFVGKLLISTITASTFITLYGENGEIVSLILNDPMVNNSTFEFAVVSMLSISCGDLKRLPTYCRAIISKNKIKDDGLIHIKSNLRLNSKYVKIGIDDFKKSLFSFFEEHEIAEKEEVYNRLINAFLPYQYVQLEENYILNTLSKQLKLSDFQAETLLSQLRMDSLSDINHKLYRKLDSRIYLTLSQNNLFEKTPE